MDANQTIIMLVGAIGALWALVTGFGTAVIKGLRQDVKDLAAAYEKRLAEERVECKEEISRLNGKLDSAGDLMIRQAESQQKQIESLQLLVSTLQAAINKQGTRE